MFKHGYPTAGGCLITTFEGEILHFKPYEVLGSSLCPIRHMEVLSGLMQEGEAASMGQNIPRNVFQGASLSPSPWLPKSLFPMDLPHEQCCEKVLLEREEG